MITKAIEDYLKAIYQVELDQGSVATTTLAERLNLTAASVTGMLKKLAALDLVSYTRYQGVVLSDQGRAIALRTVRYHRLAERYLADVLGMPWDEVHAEAEEWEHVISERVARRFDAALGNPTTDPHGEPIPAVDGAVQERNEVALSSLYPGASATIARVRSDDGAFLRYLGTLGLYPGVLLRVTEVAPFGGPLTVTLGQTSHVVGRPVAERVYVMDVADETE